MNNQENKPTDRENVMRALKRPEAIGAILVAILLFGYVNWRATHVNSFLTACGQHETVACEKVIKQCVMFSWSQLAWYRNSDCERRASVRYGKGLFGDG